MRQAVYVAVFAALLLPALVWGQWTVYFYRSGDTTAFAFGTDPAATDMFDPGIDMGWPPGWSGFDGYFPIDDSLYPMINHLRRDIRAVADSVYWVFVAEWVGGSASEPETISWNPASMPSAYGTVYFDTIADMSTAVDMGSISSYVFEDYPDTVFFMFIAGVAPTDTTPPYATNWYPPCGSDSVPVDIESLSVDIIDALSGVDESTISVSVNGFDVTMWMTITPIVGGFHVAYFPSDDLPYDADINVVVSAADTLGNSMTESCIFHTEPAPTTAYSITGFVYDTLTFEGIPGATVVDVSLTYAATTDDSGYYEILNVPDGEYIFVATAVGYGADTATIVVSGADVEHDFYLTPAAVTVELYGTVTDSSTGNPIEGAVVEAIWGSGSASDTTGSDGTYSIADVPGGEAVIVTASAEGYYPDTIVGSYATDTEINFALVPVTYRVYGTITLEGETDHSGTTVELSGVGTTTTDSAGYFEFTSVAPGTYGLVASHAGFDTLDTTITVVDADVEVVAELSASAPALLPPRNVTASYDDYAGVIVVEWEPPLEEGLEELAYDDGDIEGYYVPLTDFMFTGMGVLFSVETEMELVSVKLGYVGTVNLQCDITDWAGDGPGSTVYGSETATDYISPADYWVEFDFSDDGVTVAGDFFVMVTPAEGWDSLWPMVDSLGVDTYDDYQWCEAGGSWFTLSDASAGGLSGFVWLVRAYVRTSGGRVVELHPKTMVLPQHVSSGGFASAVPSGRTLRKVRDLRSFDPQWFRYGRVSGLHRALDAMEPMGYRVYRSESEFSSTTDPGVELIHEYTTPETTYYADWDIEPDIEYYYGVTAVYPEGESPLSEVVVGRAIDFRPPARILILDWDHGDSLASAGTEPEEAALYNMMSSVIEDFDPADVYISDQDEWLQHFLLYDPYSYTLNYDYVFLITGNDHRWVLTSSWDTLDFITYVESGGKLFIEGADFAYFMSDFCPHLLELMGVDFVADGDSMEEGNVRYLTTVDPSFFGASEPFDVQYSYRTWPDHYVDEISARPGAQAILRSQPSEPPPVGDGTRVVFFDDITYQTVFSTIYMGAMWGDYPASPGNVFMHILEHLGLPVTKVAEGNPKPQMPALLGCKPNPFNTSTAITFSLPERCRATLEVLDPTGRVVAKLVDEVLAPGLHSVRWNAKDEAGNDLPSGVYTYRLQAAGHTLAGKAVLVK